MEHSLDLLLINLIFRILLAFIIYYKKIVAMLFLLRQNYYFGPYILRSWSIWFIHFGINQFGPHYFQVVVNFL